MKAEEMRKISAPIRAINSGNFLDKLYEDMQARARSGFNYIIINIPEHCSAGIIETELKNKKYRLTYGDAGLVISWL